VAIDTWESDMEQCYIPIICRACGQKVSVRGKISENGIKFESCPNCESPLPVCHLMPDDDYDLGDAVAEEDIVVQVTFFTNGEIQEASFKLGPYQDVISVMQTMISSACITFQHRKDNAGEIKLEYLRTEMEELPKREQEAMRDYLDILIRGDINE
jgi:hypothetical protein